MQFLTCMYVLHILEYRSGKASLDEMRPQDPQEASIIIYTDRHRHIQIYKYKNRRDAMCQISDRRYGCSQLNGQSECKLINTPPPPYPYLRMISVTIFALFSLSFQSLQLHSPCCCADLETIACTGTHAPTSPLEYKEQHKTRQDTPLWPPQSWSHFPLQSNFYSYDYYFYFMTS